MDIGTWLRGLGLDRYEAAFRENEIDETVLPSLTLEDLKDLGVSLVGHRRKLLDARRCAPTQARKMRCVSNRRPQARPQRTLPSGGRSR
jgi:hypothetical protein